MSRLFFCFVLLQSLLIYSEEEAPSGYENVFSTIVGGSVSAITGLPVIHEVDCVVPSLDPLSFERVYTHPTDTHFKSHWGGWSLTSYQELIPKGGDFFYRNGLGTLLRLSSYSEKRYVNETFRGISNGSRGLSGKESQRNLILDKSGEKYLLKDGKGQTTTFSRLAPKARLLAETVDKPSGSKLKLKEVEGDFVLVESFSTSGDFMGSILSESIKDHQLSIRTSDGKEVRYFFAPQKEIGDNPAKGQWYELPLKVEKNFAPSIEYRYDPYFHIINKERISRIALPEDRYIAFEYYKHPDLIGYELYQNVEKGNVAGARDHPHRGRVRKILQPIGPTKDPITSYRFEYRWDTPQRRKGETTVFNAKDEVTRYVYNENSFPTEISIRDEHDQKTILSEHFVWEENGRGNLKTHWKIMPETGEYQGESYAYDKSYNPIKQTIFGNLRGRPFSFSSVSNQGDINPGEGDFYTIERVFSEDGFNNLLKEKGSDNIEKLFSYVPGTDKVSSILESAEGEIFKRTFFFYSEGGALVEKILDDGTTSDPSDLTGVFLRRIFSYKPKLDAPCYGFPIEIEESALDIEKCQKIVLKRTTFVYNNLGQKNLEQTFDNDGNLLVSRAWIRDDWGRPIQEIFPSGKVVHRKYDQNSNIIAEEGPIEGHRKEFSYDFMNRLVEEREYFPSGEVYSIQHSYDLLNNRIASNDFRGHKTLFKYDRFGRLIETILPTDLDGNQPVFRKKWGLSNRVIEETDPCGAITQYRYTSSGNLYQTVFSDGSQETTDYLLQGLPSSTTSRSGLETVFTYNSRNQLIKKVSLDTEENYTYKGSLLSKVVDPEGVATHFTYDPFGRKIEEEREGGRIVFQYDPFDRIISTAYWNREEFLYSEEKRYDSSGLVVEEWLQQPDGSKTQKKTFTYDLLGRPIEEEVCGLITKRRFDPFGRLTQEENSLGEVTRIIYDDFYSYQGVQILRKTILDHAGRRHVIDHDPLGREISEASYDSLGNLLSESSTRYDLAGRKISVTEFLVGRSQTRTIRFNYDLLGHLIEMIEGEQITRYTYTPFGTIQTVVRPNGTVIFHGYDEKGRLAHLFSSDQTIDEVYKYNKRGQLIEIEDKVHELSTKRSYSPAGHLIKETLGTGHTLHFERDPIGRATLVTLPDSSSYRRRFEGTFLKTVERNGYVHTYNTYNASGQPVQMTLISGDSLTISRDSLQRTTSIKGPFHVQDQITYDPSGNLVSYVLNGSQVQFAYTPLNQLIEEKDHSYTYDSTYNRLTKNGVCQKFDEWDHLLDDGELSYTYDLNGCLTQAGPFSFRYDAWDRLIEAKTPSGTFQYIYDSFHRRLKKKKPDGTTTCYLYELSTEIGSIENNAIKDFRLIGLGLGGDLGAAVLIELSGYTYIPLHDHIGNLITLLNSFGEYIESYSSTAFGEEKGSWWFLSPLSPWRFSSKRVDPETGWIYFGRRYYSPQTGRWTTRDPKQYSVGCNLYSYVKNSPLNRFDLWGLEDLSIDSKLFDMEFQMEYLSDDGGELLPRRLDSVFWNQRGAALAQGRYTPSKYYQVDYGDEKVSAKQIEGADHPTRKYVTIHGMNTDKEEAYNLAKHFSKACGDASMYYLCNPSLGLKNDLARFTALNEGYITPAVEKAHELMVGLLQSMPEEGKLYVIAFSEGTAIARSAYLLMNEEERKRIIARHLGTAAFIHTDVIPDSLNVYSSRDPIPHLADRGGMRVCKNNTIVLDRKSNWPTFDHTSTSELLEEFIRQDIHQLNKS